MANKHIERCLTPLVILEMQIKATKRYYFTPVRWLLYLKPENDALSVGEDVAIQCIEASALLVVT